jgi:hypothetical protein
VLIILIKKEKDKINRMHRFTNSPIIIIKHLLFHTSNPRNDRMADHRKPIP